MKKKVYALLFVMVISLLCTACGKSFTESDYDFNNGAIIYDYDDIPKNYWNALYPEEPNSFERDYFELEYNAQMSNFEHFAYSLIGFAGETYVDKPNLDVSDLDYKNYQGDYSFNSFRDTTIDVCVEVHPGEWTFSGHGNEVYPIAYYFDTELEYHPITIERVDDIIDTDYFLTELSQLKYVDTYEGWQVYIRTDSNPEKLPYAIHLFQQLGKDAIFMIEVDLPYISDDKDFDLNDFYIRLSKLVTLSTEQDYEDVPFVMPTFETNNEQENQTTDDEQEGITDEAEVPDVTDEEVVDAEDSSDADDNTSSEKKEVITIYKDYTEGKITTDEYVKYSLQSIFEYENLDERYKNNDISNQVDINLLIEENIDELSDETIQYYLECISLPGVTFLTEEELQANATARPKGFSFISHAGEIGPTIMDTINLNKIAVSENERFVVWYTTKGNAAITDEDAKMIADHLEETSYYYENLTGHKYKFITDFMNNFTTSKILKQIIILEKYGYNSSYLNKSMQVYVVSGELLNCNGAYIKYTDAISSTLGTYRDGVPVLPYILLNKDYFGNKDSIKEIASHEVMHHFQFTTLGDESIPIDHLMYEATSQWGSAKFNNTIGGDSYLIDCAGWFTVKIGEFFSEYAQEADSTPTELGYRVFPYLQLYEKYVADGTNKIVKTLKLPNSFIQLESMSTTEERNTIMKNLILYLFNQKPEYGITLHTEADYLPFIYDDCHIKGNESDINVNLGPLEVMCKTLLMTDRNLQIKVSSNSIVDNNLLCYIVKKETNKEEYEIIDEFILTNEVQIRELSADENYMSNIYIILANSSIVNSGNVTYEFILEEQSDIDPNVIFQDASTMNALEMEEISYQIALDVKKQVIEYFNALKSGNIQYLLDNNCINPEDDELVKNFQEMSQFDYADDVTKLFYEDITYDITDDMVKEWAKEIRTFYFMQNNEEKLMSLPVLYNMPDTSHWGQLVPIGIKEGTYIPFDNYLTIRYKLTHEEIFAKIREAKNILLYKTNSGIMVKFSKDSMQIKFCLNRLLEPMKAILKRNITDTNGMNINSPSKFIDKLKLYSNQYNFQNASSLKFEYAHDVYTKLLHHMGNKDFKALEELYISIDPEQNQKYAEDMFYYNGKYDDLTEGQKQFINNFYDSYYVFKVGDYAGRSLKGNDIRDGFAYVEYSYVGIFDIPLYHDYAYTFDEVKNNNFNTQHYLFLCSDLDKEKEPEGFIFNVLNDYYTLIGYAKEHIE